jgi:hypothetical protein
VPRPRLSPLLRALAPALAVAAVLAAVLAGAVRGAEPRQDAPAGGAAFGPAPGAPASPGAAPSTDAPTPSGPGAPALDPAPEIANGPPPIDWVYPPSRAVGLPFAGRLVRGVQLPAWGDDFITWDPALKRSPNRPWRRWGTDRLIRRLLTVLAAYHVAWPKAGPVLVGDLSRPHGGGFGARYGGLGHGSHQNGTDVDVYYPRRDGAPRAAWRPSQVDHAKAQWLVNAFARAGAKYVFVGPRLGLRRINRRIVQPLVHHDDHLHFRLR